MLFKFLFKIYIPIHTHTYINTKISVLRLTHLLFMIKSLFTENNTNEMINEKSGHIKSTHMKFVYIHSDSEL